MSDFVFTSPGVKFKEKDLTFVTRQIGTTFLGLVGETQKGPAFEPISIKDKTVFKNRMGGTSPEKYPNGDLRYHLPYVANSFLDESDNLYVTRVLGLSGYDSGTAWTINLEAGYGSDDNWDVPTSGTTETKTFDGNTYTFEDIDVTITINSEEDEGEVEIEISKDGSEFTKETYKYNVTSFEPLGTDNEIEITKFTYKTDELGEYNDVVLCTLRSRGFVEDGVDESAETTHYVDAVEISGNTATDDLYGNFTIVATGPNDFNEKYKVSLNPNATNFITKVLGVGGKDKKTGLFVESVYPDMIAKLDDENYGYGIKDDINIVTDYFHKNYTKTQFKTPNTPWIVSEIKNDGDVDNLFRFYSISDGNSANKEIKISILNVKPNTGEFDVYVRDFNDTDSNPVILETFTRCTLNLNSTNYIGNRIGTKNGDYSLRSNYIMVEIDDNVDPTSYPCGFEGYFLNKFDKKIPKVFYKTRYENNENVNRVYLGISETTFPTNGINQNIFNYNGYHLGRSGGELDYFEKSKGFHFDKDANNEVFYTGTDNFTNQSVAMPDSDYNELNTRKFTLAPAGGFDGWDIHRNSRTIGDSYAVGGIFDGVETNETPTNDYQAWETAINSFNNPDEVFINLFATPGINWGDNSSLVKSTINMIERSRGDALYVIDSPDVNIPQTIGKDKNDVLASRDVSSLLDSLGINSSYSCTYFPWIQIRDNENNVNVYIPPTGEVVSAMAFTDKVRFPWFAPAGLQRGVTNARKSKYRLSADAKRILYGNRINPMADFAGTGTAIFGQKTLQIEETALDRINVRRLLLQIKKLISNISVRLVFEQNDQTTIDQFLEKAIPTLQTIQRERGLYGFDIKMDDSINTPETRDRNELYGEIYLKPTRALEYIGITFVITPSGASFEDV